MIIYAENVTILNLVTCLLQDECILIWNVLAPFSTFSNEHFAASYELMSCRPGDVHFRHHKFVESLPNPFVINFTHREILRP